MVRQQKQIDTVVEVVTPENIAFDYQVAGPFRRLPAFFVDFVIRVIVILVLALAGYMFVGLMGIAGVVAGLEYILGGVLLVSYFALEWLYGGVFETYMNGQTPGKWLLGIRVVTVEGQPINGMQAMLRNIVRSVDMLPPFLIWGTPFFIPLSLTGLGAMTLNRRFQRLGDLVSGTMVVLEQRTWLLGVARLEDPRAAQLAAYLPPKFEVSRSLARALAAYVERRSFFSPARRREIARHLGDPLLRIFELPADTSHDLLLCALYYKTFIAEHGDDSGPSPFSTTPQPANFGQPQKPVYVPPPLPQEQMVTIGSGSPPSNPFIIRR